MSILIGERGLNVTRLVGEALSFVPEKLKGKHGMVVPNAQKKILNKLKSVTNRLAQVIAVRFPILEKIDVN